MLNKNNFIMFAIKSYKSSTLNESEFFDDLNRIEYIKKLFNKYKNKNILKERLILNHLIILYNVFNLNNLTSMLFYKIDKQYWEILKTFLLYLNYMPEKILYVDNNPILSNTISIDLYIVKVLRGL